MKLTRTVCLATCTSLLATGCASWYPLEPKYNESELIAKGWNAPPLTLDVMKSARLLAGWRMTMEAAAADRQVGTIVTNEVLFYGTLLAFVGAGGSFKYATEVRNVGAAAVAGSTLFTSHYQQGVQHVAFRRAADRLTCAERAIAPMAVAPAHELFDEDQKVPLNPQLEDVPRHTREFIERQRSELQAALQQVTLQPPTREQWDSILGNLKASDAKAKEMVSRLGNRHSVAGVERRIAESMAANDPTKRAPADLAEEARAKRLTIAATEAELKEVRERYTTALSRYPAALEFCLANRQQ